MHYLDNSATTQVLEEAAQIAVSFMTVDYGNPSSLHTLGFRAKCAMDEARGIIAQSMGADQEEIYFTSGGTESNNLAIFGAVNARKRLGNKIVTTAIEHPAVLNAMKELEQQGYDVEYLQPDRDGRILPAQLAAAIDDRTILVSMMLVNNETGVILPVAEAAKCIRRNKAPALLHTDAVQGYLKLPVSPRKLGADLISISGHKVHAPKGIGALYVSKSVRITARQFGGGQERNLRPGTEALPSIAAFGEAVRLAKSAVKVQPLIKQLNDRLRAGLAEMPKVIIHSPADALPNIINFSAGQVRAETMLHFLAEKGIYISSGSACGKAKASHVLEAMGLEKSLINSVLRVSFSYMNVPEDVDALLGALRDGLATLAH